MFYTKNPFNSSLDVIYSWAFTVTAGINWLYLPRPVTVYRGNFIYLSQNTAKIAIDTSGNASFSDLAWQSSVWNSLSSNSKWRFYLTPITNLTIYQTSFSLSHTYKSIGLYNISLTFLSANETFIQVVNITDRMYLFFLSVKK